MIDVFWGLFGVGATIDHEQGFPSSGRSTGADEAGGVMLMVVRECWWKTG